MNYKHQGIAWSATLMVSEFDLRSKGEMQRGLLEKSLLRAAVQEVHCHISGE